MVADSSQDTGSSKDSQILQLQERVHKLQEEVEGSNQQLLDFAHMVAHDLKSPLRRITMYAQIIAEDTESDFSIESLESLKRISVNAERLQGLIDSILGYAFVADHEDPLEIVDLQELITEVQIEQQDMLIEEDALVFAASLPEIPGYYAALKQLCVNLIENAIKYRRDEPPRLFISCSENATDFELVFEDNGQGIPDDKVDVIFKPFKRLHLKDEIEGSGLGLAICQKIVQIHSGTIRVESVVDEGTKIIINLPK